MLSFYNLNTFNFFFNFKNILLYPLNWVTNSFKIDYSINQIFDHLLDTQYPKTFFNFLIFLDTNQTSISYLNALYKIPVGFLSYTALQSIIIIVSILIAVAFFTLAERKVMGAMQRRKGPNVVGFWGILQPLADGLKLFLKEIIVPTKANTFLFLSAPVITFTLSLISWTVIPIGPFVLADIELGLLFVYAVSSLAVYGIIIAGWSSNSKYAFLGAVRATAQMISYEVSIGFIFLIVAICSKSLNLTEIVLYQKNSISFFIPLFPTAISFLIAMLAETNRAPFDLPEAEAELVAGYNVEYSSIPFAMFFLGEYSNMLMMASLFVCLFLGGYTGIPIISSILFFIMPEFWFILKLMFPLLFFIWVRASLPRYRYDQLMDIGWKVLLPFNFAFFIFIIGFLYFIQLYI